MRNYEQGEKIMATLLQNGIRTIAANAVGSVITPDNRVFGEKIGLLGKFFGCEHGDLSRPFSQSQVAYRSCLKCGARKQFNTETLETFGTFYYPPVILAEDIYNF